MRFIADAMLGRLARWLRFLGFDTLYHPGIADRVLLKLAIEQDRVILTRDSHFKRKDIKNCLMVKSDLVEEQLRQVMSDLDLEFPSTGRCMNCNGILEEIDNKSDIRDDIPEHVYRSFNKFLRCTQCGNIYWEGSHYRNFRESLGKAMRQEGE